MNFEVLLGLLIPVISVAVGVVVFVAVVTYLKLILKRFFFKNKIEKNCKKAGVSCEWKKSWLGSMFSHKGGVDLVIGDKYAIRWISAPFRFTRMHFQDENRLQVQLNRTAKRARTVNMVTVSTYKLGLASQSLAEEVGDKKMVVLMHPAPGEVTKISGSGIVQIGNGDPLFGSATYCDKLRLFTYIEG